MTITKEPYECQVNIERDLPAHWHVDCQCVCPQCGVIYTRQVESAHANSPFAWRRAGYLVIFCKDCRKERG